MIWEETSRAVVCVLGDETNCERIYMKLAENLCVPVKQLATGYDDVKNIPASVLQGWRSVARNSRGDA